MKMPVINLEDPDCLPGTLRAELMGCANYFFRPWLLEQVMDEPRVRRVVERINEHCAQNMVVGYHYTRAIREDLLTDGLRPRSGEEVRSVFLARFGGRFSGAQLSGIRAMWDRCYDDGARKVRDGRIFFNFTRAALGDRSSDPLLKNYGGEQVYFYIDELPGVGEILSSIGESFVVKCALVPSEVRTSIENPWGQILVSSYHRRINPGAKQVDQDGYQFSPVPPNRIELLTANPSLNTRR